MQQCGEGERGPTAHDERVGCKIHPQRKRGIAHAAPQRGEGGARESSGPRNEREQDGKARRRKREYTEAAHPDGFGHHPTHEQSHHDDLHHERGIIRGHV